MTSAEQKMFDLLQKTLATQARQIDEQAKQLEAQAKLLEEQSAYIKELLQKIDELTGGPKDSHNSSKPPSSDGYSKPAPKSLKKPSGKKQGGQKGHKGHGLKIEQEPTEIIKHYPSTCSGCPQFGKCKERVCEKRYDIDIRIERTVVMHQQMECVCTFRDNAKIRGGFPSHITGTKQYGLNTKALISLLANIGMVSHDRIVQLMDSMARMKMSTGTVHNMLEELSKKVEVPVAAIRSMISKLPLVHFDETGLRVEGGLYWVHSCCNDRYTYLSVQKKRGTEAMDAIDILPNYRGIAVHDCWASYFKYETAIHALCNTHLARELVYANENLKQEWAKALMELLFEILHQRDERQIRGAQAFSADELHKYSERYDQIIQLGIDLNPIPEKPAGKRGRTKRGKVRALLDRLTEHKQEFLLFAYNWDVPFTNNEAERSVRWVKVKQGVSGCFRSKTCAEEYATTMSFLATARKNGVPYFDAIIAALKGEAMPMVMSWA